MATGFNNAAIVTDDQSTSRTNLGLGTIATQAASAVAITGGSITATTLSNKFITESTTARTLAIADAGATIYCTASSADTTITIPTNASVAIPIGSYFTINNATTSKLVNISPAGGVTFVNIDSPVVGNAGLFILLKTDTNSWKYTYLYESFITSSTFTWGGTTTGGKSIYLIRNNNTIILNIDAFTVNPSPTTETAQCISNTAIPARFRPFIPQTYQSDVTLNSGSKSVARYVVDGSGLLYYQSSSGGNLSGTRLDTEPAFYTYLVQ